MSFLPLQSQNFSLAGSGCSIGDTVLNLKSFKDILGNTIAMSDLGTIAYMTIEPGNGTQEEQISFTGVTQNADGSAQLTGIKTVLFKSPYTETSGFRVTHPGSVVAILTNTAAFYNKFGILANDEAITGNWTVGTGAPTASGGITSKAYVLSVVNGGTVTTDQVVVAGSAGENLTAGNIAYLKSDGTWYKASSAAATTCLNVQLGVVQGTVSSGNTCTILIAGMDKTQSGLSAGTTYFLSTGGAISSSAGSISVSIGVGITSANLEFKPGFTTGNATASITGRASSLPISATGSTTLDSSWIPTTLFKWGGTGADGALTVTSGTTTIDLGNAATFTKNYSSISITGTGAIKFINPATKGTFILIKCSGGVTLTSSATPMVDASGCGAAGAIAYTQSGGGGGAVASGVNGTNGQLVTTYLKTNTGVSSNGSAIGAGGAIATLTLDTTYQNVYNEFAFKYPGLFVGAGAGNGGGTTSGSYNVTGAVGGFGGGALVFEVAGAWNFTTASGISVAGTNGTVGTINSGSNAAIGGSGGGGGGSFLALVTTNTANTGTITVSGGVGANSVVAGTATAYGGGGGSSYANAGSNGTSTGTNSVKTGGDGGAGLSYGVALNTEFV